MPNFFSFFCPKTRRMNAALAFLQEGLPIPLDLYVALLEDGVDVTELERNT